VDLTVISGAISGLKTASDLAKAIVSTNTAVEVNAKAIELQRALLAAYGDALSAKETQSELQEEIRRLKSQAAQNEEFVADMKRYKLFEPWPGSPVYALKESMSSGEPAHYLCAYCYQSKKKAILYSGPGTKSPWCHLRCPACKTEIQSESMEPGVRAIYPPE
jgi:hypothetical protein